MRRSPIEMPRVTDRQRELIDLLSLDVCANGTSLAELVTYLRRTLFRRVLLHFDGNKYRSSKHLGYSKGSDGFRKYLKRGSLGG